LKQKIYNQQNNCKANETTSKEEEKKNIAVLPSLKPLVSYIFSFVFFFIVTITVFTVQRKKRKEEKKQGNQKIREQKRIQVTWYWYWCSAPRRTFVWV